MIDPIVLGCLAAIVVLVIFGIIPTFLANYFLWRENNYLRKKLGNRKRDDKGRFVKGDK